MGLDLFNKAKQINIETKSNINKIKRNKNLITELAPNYSLSKGKKRINLSKNSSSSKNKINQRINSIKEKNNNEEKNEIAKNELIPLTNKNKIRKVNNKKMRDFQKYFNDLGINDTYKLYIPQIEVSNTNKNSINNISKRNNQKIVSRYEKYLPNLYPNKIRKNNSNSLNHYENKKYDIIPKPEPNRKMNLLLNKKFGIKFI